LAVTAIGDRVDLEGGETMSAKVTSRTWTQLTAAAVALLAVGWASVSIAAERDERHVMVTPAELEWGPIASMAPGAQMAMIEGDLGKAEAFTFRLKLPADYVIAPHVHPAHERVTVLSGALFFAHGSTFDRAAARRLPAGSIAIMPPGAPMYGYTEEETVLQIHGTGPWGIRYLDPEDDPRS
jgi:quercetin dioxygenase-like cupin family protein